MKNQDVLLYCQYCSRKFILDENVIEIQLADVPAGLPFVDKEDGFVKQMGCKPRRRMFRCPGCGRGVASKVLTTPSQEVKTLYKGDFRHLAP